MRAAFPLILASVASLFVADVASAQPYGPPPPPNTWRGDHGPDHHPGGPPPGAQNYYYNGRWVGRDEWDRRGPDRDRWAESYRRRHRDHDDDSSALVAGIIGFALGAAIVGSQQEAEHARNADRSWDDRCAAKYRSYDRRSRTYLGRDGLRHYCQ